MELVLDSPAAIGVVVGGDGWVRGGMLVREGEGEPLPVTMGSSG